MESGVWKNCRIVLSLFMLLVMFGAGGQIQSSVDAFAAPKNNVSYTVKDGTLTVYGKGEAPYIEIPDEKKITKSKVLEKVTMPGAFEIRTWEDDEASIDLQWNSDCYIGTIYFNTPLSLKTLAYVRSNNLIVCEDDEKYTSVDGVIYSKDKKSIVRVPAHRKTLTLIPECEEFCIQSVTYATEDWEGDCYVVCDMLEKIVLPDTVKKIDSGKYFEYPCYFSEATEIIIQTDQLDSDSISELFEEFSEVEEETVLRQLAYVSERDGMFINDRDSCLLLYNGAEEVFTVPDDVKKIGKMAFSSNEGTKKVVIPETVREIGDMAFYKCSDLTEVIIQSACPFQPLLFEHCEKLMTDVKIPKIKLGWEMFSECRYLKKVVLPEGVTEIPNYTFKSCNNLTDVSLPSTVDTIGSYAFYDTKVSDSILQQGRIKEVKPYAFAGVGWESFEIPATIEKAGASAFCTCAGARVTICGAVKELDPHTFASDAVITYLTGISQWQTGIYIPQIKITKEDDVTNPYSEIEFRWQKVTGSDGYEIQVCSEPSFTKKVKTYHAKKGKTEMELSDPDRKMKYVRIRPFQDIDGTRKYGRWCADKVKVIKDYGGWNTDW